jgi:hypothetical protein
VRRARPERTASVAAARWPLLLVISVGLVGVAVAAPFALFAALAERVGPTRAGWSAAALGAAMLVILSIAWVLLRARRHELEEP